MKYYKYLYNYFIYILIMNSRSIYNNEIYWYIILYVIIYLYPSYIYGIIRFISNNDKTKIKIIIIIYCYNSMLTVSINNNELSRIRS